MEQLITSYIIQSAECRLPEIGRFRRSYMHAESDIANKQISPPRTEILFTGKEEKLSDGLVQYVARKKSISSQQAMDEIKTWCKETKTKLKNGEEIFLEPLGSLKKASSGNIFFHTEHQNTFFSPVDAERVIHKNSDHQMLVGDRETTTSAMTEFYNGDVSEPVSRAWKVIAIILFVIALILLFFYFYGYPFSVASLGNHSKVVPSISPETYATP